ncbi:hypothetical protein Tco_0025139 [Tanacetum coccineum]
MSALRSIEGKSKGGDDIGNGIGRSGGVPDGRVLDGSGWEVDGGSESQRISRTGCGGGDNTSKGGDTGSGGDGICGSGDDSRVPKMGWISWLSYDVLVMVGQSRPELGAPPPPHHPLHHH